MKLKTLVIVFFVILLAGNVIAYEYVPGELIVKYKSNAVKEKAVNFEGQSFNVLSSKKILKENNYRVLKFNKNSDIEGLAEELMKRDDVEYAEPNYIYHTFFAPDDAEYSSKWDLQKIGLEYVWNGTTGSSDVVIAIIDTGVDWNHPDLALNIWNNTDEVDYDSSDNDGNGFVDDARGWDFCGNTGVCGTDPEDSNPMDNNGHGTHCAGISGAVSNNALGTTGACWNCKLMAVKAANSSGSLSVEDVVKAINYATTNGADIISMSFGGSHSISVQEAINNSYNSGVILVAAAGNSNSQTENYPAAYSNVIGVAATDTDDSKASFSNYGTWISIATPGVDIYSTYFDDTYSTISGTSMATPLAAGGIGLLLSYNNSLNQTEILNSLINTGVNVSGYTFNRVNFYESILSFDRTNPVLDVDSPADGETYLVDNISINYSVSDDLILNKVWYDFNGINTTLNGNTSLILAGGSYTIVFYANDSAGNLVYDAVSFSVGNLSAEAVSPANDTEDSDGNVSFNCSAESVNYELVNISLFYNNVLNQTALISGFENSGLFNVNNIPDNENATWYCYTCAFDECKESAVKSLKIRINDAPYLVQNIPNQNWSEDNFIELDMDSYFDDEENNDLGYGVVNVENISISADNSTNVIRFTPQANFTGIRYAIVRAYDSEFYFDSNNFNLTINNVADCGDGVCESGESCSSCAGDCGGCSTPSGGSTSGTTSSTNEDIEEEVSEEIQTEESAAPETSSEEKKEAEPEVKAVEEPAKTGIFSKIISVISWPFAAVKKLIVWVLTLLL